MTFLGGAIVEPLRIKLYGVCRFSHGPLTKTFTPPNSNKPLCHAHVVVEKINTWPKRNFAPHALRKNKSRKHPHPFTPKQTGQGMPNQRKG
jgi:hypothetical protein